MLDSALLKTNFVGRDGFVWWIGRVANPKCWRDKSTDTDAGWAFRCKVRIIGYHPFDPNILPDEDLPWSHVLVDATSGSGQACLGESSRMMGGETVFGFFMDGEEGQQPVIFGALARNVNPLGAKNSDGFLIPQGPMEFEDKDAWERENAFGILSGREAGVDGQTTMPLRAGKPAGTPSANASNRVGEERSNSPGELADGREGISKGRAADVTFANVSTGTVRRNNACENDALSDITHTIGSFLKTVNSLTEFAGVYIDTARNVLVDINKIVGKAARLVSGAVKLIIKQLRDKILGLLGKRFRDFIGLIVPEPQKNPVVNAFKRIMDIIYCIFDNLGIDLGKNIKNMFKDMIGNSINNSVCAVEQAVGAVMADVNDKMTEALRPVTMGLDWLTGAIGGIGSLLGKIQSYIDMLLTFLACDSLQCKTYEDWTQGMGLSAKPAISYEGMLNNMSIINNLDQAGAMGFQDRFSLLSLMGNGVNEFFDCNEKTNNPKTQDDLGDAIPPGFTWADCIPPKVEVHGDGTKTAALLPIISSENGSVLTLEILDKGYGYSEPPFIAIIDKTNHGGGAEAQAILDGNGSIVDIYMISNGTGYCQATNVVPPKFPVTEGPGIGVTSGIGTDGTSLDTVDPYITFTTPADDAVGVQPAASLSITFNEPVRKGIGYITLTESITNVVHEKIPVEDARISFLSDRIIEIDPITDFKTNTEYFVSMSEGSFTDFNNNQFAGIALTDTYNFTTRGVSGIGSQAVGIVTTLIPHKPGIGYTSGDTGQVGSCYFDLLLTPAGSVVGVKNVSCKDKHRVSPEVTINTKTGIGARLIPVISYSPDYVADIGERPAPNLIVNVIDCVGKPLSGVTT